MVNLLNSESMIAFIPLMEKVHKKDGRYYMIKTPIYPNYIFIKTDLDHTAFDLWLYQFCQNHNGIVKQLKNDKEGTSALYPEEAAFLEQLMDENYTVRQSSGMIEGSRIVIIDGPLCGMESRIEKIDRHKRIAYLKNELLGKSIKISLEILKKI
ncbi:transcription antiterminator [Clostridiaceae bacterium DONG20-135]|uniref:Transcription antiterminator n=1 Tax=Copranaerobaculum intestinale TaxID=2692629 RepID=A0A6N8U620_9FIRM|nr:transcription antiterminator [Copranaerobaculum intestinale]